MISNTVVLIVDNSLATIDSMTGALIKVGFAKDKIYSTKSYKDALEKIKNLKPGFLITDYLVDGKPGLELISCVTEQGANKITMIITHNNTSSAIAEAAEELVDDYVIKPFQASSLVERIQVLIQRKMFPPRYIEEIRIGKQLLLENDFHGANIQFQNASFLDPKPTLAYYYLGHSNYLQKQFEEAISGYKRGLEYKPLHFKCLTGQFDTFFEQKRFHEAYEMVPDLVQNYPIGPKRLGNLFVAAVYAGRLDEVPHYYDLFLKLDHVTQELRRVFSAALFVAGRFHLNRHEAQKAISSFDCGLQVIGADALYIEKVIRALIQAGPEFIAFGDKYLSRFPSESVGGLSYSVLSYLLSQNKRTDIELIVQGRQLVQKNYADADCFRVLIKALLAEKKSLLADDYILRASRLFPEIRSEFQT